MNLFDDEIGEMIINYIRGYFFFDISSIYYGIEMGGEKFVDVFLINMFCVY